MRAPWGQEGGGSTATKGEVSVGRWLWGRCSPRGGASATLTCPNLSSPGRAVINYWAAHTRDELGFIECHTPDLGNKSLDSKQTHWWGGCLQTANAWVTAVSGTWRRVNQEMNKPPLMNKQPLHGPFLKLTTAATWRRTQSQIDGLVFFLQSVTKRLPSRLRPRQSRALVPLLCCEKDDNFLCGGYMLG